MCRLLVVWVHLHGECLPTIEKFQQQRELPLRLVTTEERRAIVRNEVVKPSAREWSVYHDTLIIAVVHDLPAFGTALHVADRFAEFRAEPPAAP